MTDPLAAVLALARGSLDRVAHRRYDEPWLAAAWAHPETRVLPVAGGRALVHDADPVRLLLLPSRAAPAGERYLLGVGPDGRAYFAVAAPALPAGEGLRAVGLRDVGAALPDLEAALLVYAVALTAWHRTCPRCPRCGGETVVEAAGHVRRCPADGSEHHPRTDPAVIMLVTDPDDRALLGRQRQWAEGRFSTLAGFVEPGESLEQAVVREVHEEVGLRVGAPVYVASQPWPFPASLMVGFTARAVETGIRADGVEIAEARWFARADLARAVTDGAVTLPPPVSIARHLVERWYGEPIPDARWD